MYRHYLTILSTRIEVFPLNFNSTTLTDEREREQIFYRRKFGGTLRFHGDDFYLLHLAELTAPCENILYEIEKKESGSCDTYYNYWTGRFSTTDGRFDLDQCTFDITPMVYDEYSIFDDLGDEQLNILDIPTVVTTISDRHTYTRNRWLVDTIQFLLDYVAPGSTLHSWFFTADTHPVIGGENKYKNITIAQKSDIKRPTSSNPATVASLSFNELMQILRMFNVWWTYRDGVLYVEHLTYFTASAGMDLRTQKLSEKSNKYTYDKTEMPKYERFSFMESGDGNFLPMVISYDSPCVNQDKESNTWEYATNVTTDLDYIEVSMGDPEAVGIIDDAGFVLLGNYLIGADYNVYYGNGYDSPFGRQNIFLSWSFLIRQFFVDGRVLLTGYINSAPADFRSARKTKLQEIKAIVCKENNYDPEQYITTELGEVWFAGQKGFVKTAEIRPSGNVNFRLLYGEADDEEIVIPPVRKTLHIVTLAISYEIWSYLSEPNIYDTYYWVWINETECQEIMIPAGEVYDYRALTDPGGPIIDLKFYYSHPSLSGWMVYLNDNEPLVACDLGDCPGSLPDPPPVPDAPNAFGASQLDTCGPVLIGWSGELYATYYEIWRKPNTSMNDVYGLLDTTVNTSYNDYGAGVHDGIEFCYKIKACNISGCSGFSNEVCHVVMC